MVTADGVERPIDVLVVATGFHTTDLPIAEQIRGREGRSLADTWRESGMAAYKGTTVHGFPNLFFIVGPNTGLGHSSMVLIIESQVAYIREAIRTMRLNAYATVEPTASRAAAVERRHPAPDEAHRVEHRRLLQLVPRRARPQHRPVAAHDVQVPRAAAPSSTSAAVRRRRPAPTAAREEVTA